MNGCALSLALIERRRTTLLFAQSFHMRGILESKRIEAILDAYKRVIKYPEK